MSLLRKRLLNSVLKNYVKIIHHRVRRKRSNAYGLCIVARYNWKRIPLRITSTIIHPVTIRVHVTWIVLAYKRKTFVKSFVIAAVIARIVFPVVVARLNVIPNNVPVIWRCENAIQIYARRVELINLNWLKLLARMSASKEVYVSLESIHPFLLWIPFYCTLYIHIKY